MNTLGKSLIGAVVAIAALALSVTSSQSAPLRFKDSTVEMPPGNLEVPAGSAGKMLEIPPRYSDSNTSKLLLERIILLEKELELMDKRLSELEGRNK